MKDQLKPLKGKITCIWVNGNLRKCDDKIECINIEDCEKKNIF